MGTAFPVAVLDVMTKEVVTIGRNAKLLAAEELMRQRGIRHLPVVDDDGALAGVLSQRDLFHSGLIKALGYGAHAQHHALETVLVKEAMQTEPVTTTPDTPLQEAARLMLQRKIGCLVVVAGATIVGLLAESDFVKLADRTAGQGTS